MESLFVVGLGNPGSQYQYNRHNIGQMLVKKLAAARGCAFQKQGLNYVTDYIDDGMQIVIAYPDQYMNLSGKAVLKLLRGDKKAVVRLLVLVDDLETKMGACHMAFDGGARGHNGIRSIHQELGTKGFYQLRIGIGRPVGQTEVSDYVLSNFSLEESKTIEEMYGEVEHSLSQWIQSKRV